MVYWHLQKSSLTLLCIIAIYKDKPTEHESVMIWRGEAWKMPPMYRNERHWMIFGAVAKSLWESDTINIRIIRSK